MAATASSSTHPGGAAQDPLQALYPPQQQKSGQQTSASKTMERSSTRSRAVSATSSLDTLLDPAV